LCHRQLLVVVGDKVDDDLLLGLRLRIYDHPLRVAMATLAARNTGWRRHLLPLVRH
jgi:hypothetical protein